jgi:E3 ubiquitin-protein ligase synoviolin
LLPFHSISFHFISSYYTLIESAMQDPDPQQDEEERRRLVEEEMERRMLQEEELAAAEQHYDDDHVLPGNEQEGMIQRPPEQQQVFRPKRSGLSYTSTSFFAAVFLLWYALRTREQWFLALTFLASSKYAYVIFGNAIVAVCVKIFYGLTHLFLGELRLAETEGLADFFRWNVTETCLALTMFRSELTVESGVLFLFLILLKCLHWVVELRESHLRMTQDAVTAVERGIFRNFPKLDRQHTGLMGMLQVLLLVDIVAVVHSIHSIATEGPSVHLLFGFEAAIQLVTALSLVVLWNLHTLDGFLHYWHDVKLPGGPMLLHMWKDRKATLLFAMQVQAQGAKFVLYCTFFAIVFTYYGLPINLFREVYLSFQALQARLMAFAKYRKLVQGMNRFSSPSAEKLREEDSVCIICRDEMCELDSKELPGCGHVFHTSCLREWLVQQQSCPTCRGDIAVMERARARAQLGTPEEQRGEERQEAAEQQEPQDASARLRNEALAMAQQEQERQQLPAPGTVRAPRDLMTELQENDDNDGTETVKTEEQKQAEEAVEAISKLRPWGQKFAPPKREVFPQEEQPQSVSQVFPALYKVVSPLGAPVHQLPEGGGSVQILRTVPCGMAVLCMEMELQNCGNDLGLMLKLPDKGWVWENQLEYLTSVPTRKVGSEQK